MGLIENLKDVAELVKKAGNMELYRRISGLEGEVIDLTRTNRHLTLENDELKARLAFREKLQFQKPFYYADGDPTPFCPRCWEADQQAIHLTGPDRVSDGNRYGCPACHRHVINRS